MVRCAGSGGVHPKSAATDGYGDQEQVERADKGYQGEPSRVEKSRHDHQDLTPVSLVGEPATQLSGGQCAPHTIPRMASASSHFDLVTLPRTEQVIDQEKLGKRQWMAMPTIPCLGIGVLTKVGKLGSPTRIQVI